MAWRRDRASYHSDKPLLNYGNNQYNGINALRWQAMAWNFITHRNNQFSTSLKTELPLGQQSMTSTAALQLHSDQMASATEGCTYDRML